MTATTGRARTPMSSSSEADPRAPYSPPGFERSAAVQDGVRQEAVVVGAC
ncbi:hypothetical protein [Streptomyces mirabilis]